MLYCACTVALISMASKDIYCNILFISYIDIKIVQLFSTNVYQKYLSIIITGQYITLQYNFNNIVQINSVGVPIQRNFEFYEQQKYLYIYIYNAS